MRTAIRLALAAAVLAAAPAPAAAQDLSKDAVRTAPKMAVSREVARYQFTVGRDAGLPAEVTVFDRGGEITATYRLPGQRTAQPMLVTVLDMDLVLQAETDKGVLTLQLYEQNGAAGARPITGKWTLGSRSGELRGRTE